MRSSSARDLAGLLVAVLGAVGIMLERAPLADEFLRVKSRADVYALPPPDQTYVASLGYRSALADLIFGHVLVSYGLHFQEKHRFEFVGDYLDTIVRLDPKFRDPYRFADTLLTLQPETPPQDSYRRARRIQEQGLRELPYDQELWDTSGQFLAYLAPAWLSDEEEKAEFRRSGAQKLLRACELIGQNDALPFHCITAANLLTEQGDHDALNQRSKFLVRLANMSDDPELQDLANNYLRRTSGAQEADRAAARAARFNSAWKQDMPFVPRTEIHALGPRFDSAACSGISPTTRSACSSSWLAWSASAENSLSP